MEKQTKSLQELSAVKALETIRTEEHPEAAFRELEAVQQELIFSSLLQEYKRLREVEQSHEFLKKSVSRMPHADRVVHLSGLDRLGRQDEDHDEDSDFEEAEDPFDQARAFRLVWRYGTEEDNARLEDETKNWALERAGQRIRYSPLDILRYSDHLPLRALSYAGKSRPWEQLFDKGKKGDNILPKYCSDIITSQLMLYRLTVTLGPPPSKFMESMLDGYKCCWNSLLVLREEADSGEAKIVNHLSIGEHKGSVSVHFSGTKEGSDKMLELLNYLVGDDCAHSYDGVRCGQQA